jgi:hypothetical protein
MRVTVMVATTGARLVLFKQLQCRHHRLQEDQYRLLFRPAVMWHCSNVTAAVEIVTYYPVSRIIHRWCRVHCDRKGLRLTITFHAVV